MPPSTCVHAIHVGTPVTCFVAPRGAPSKAPAAPSTCVPATLRRKPQAFLGPTAPSACVPATHFGTPLTRFVAP
eukprot:8978010-Pyramimonas_sp.AAC.1